MKLLRLRLLSCAIAIAVFGGCSDSVASNRIRDTGLVEFGAGGCYRILAEKARRAYQPLNLPKEYKVRGIRVRFEAVLKPTFNQCLDGEVIELISIERLN